MKHLKGTLRLRVDTRIDHLQSDLLPVARRLLVAAAERGDAVATHKLLGKLEDVERALEGLIAAGQPTSAEVAERFAFEEV